ncbi:MAG: invasion associated locus B family protein [Shimia sp.]|uniref:invasion associated locus B family protein n=1 Tax=Shimia sp. TaxID=1954381 RepID=UPI001B1BB610|nr:invasion associated locus B family protein [Shimia sp.]MBO6897212.1 invasion associated locus B family protein [Shimia sp.]
MQKISFFAAAVTLAVMAGPSFSQGVPSLADGSLAMGEAVNEAAQPITPAQLEENVSSEIIGDWDLQCATTGPEPRPCRMYQLMRDDTGNPVSEVTLFSLPVAEGEAVAGATVIVPLETLLTAQLTMSVDGKTTRRYPFAFCNQLGCIARIGLSAEDISNFKSGNIAVLNIVPALAPTQSVNVNMSLSGFTKAFEKAENNGQ